MGGTIYAATPPFPPSVKLVHSRVYAFSRQRRIAWTDAAIKALRIEPPDCGRLGGRGRGRLGGGRGQGLGGSSHTAVRSGPTVQGSYLQPWTREDHWNEDFSQSSGTRGASRMMRWSIWPHSAARRFRSGSARARSISRFTAGLSYSLKLTLSAVVEAAVEQRHDRLPGVVPDEVRAPDGLSELVLQTLGVVSKRLEVVSPLWWTVTFRSIPARARDSWTGLLVAAYLPLPRAAKPRVSPLG